MRTRRIVHWATTIIVALAMFGSAVGFGFSAQMKGGFAHLGLPDWFRIELTVAKMLGAVALVLPMAPPRMRDFAYAGFTITIASACVAHMASGDGFLRGLEPLWVLTLLAASYRTKDARNAAAGDFSGPGSRRAAHATP